MTLYDVLNIVPCMQKINILYIYLDKPSFSGYVPDFLFKKDYDKYSELRHSLVRSIYTDEGVLYIVLS